MRGLKCAAMRPGPSRNAPVALLAAIPATALTVAVPFVNHVEPRLFGMPLLLWWIVAWVLLTPAFLWTAGRLERHW
jgi:hypothetical protein